MQGQLRGQARMRITEAARQIVNSGLARTFADAQPASKRRVVVTGLSDRLRAMVRRHGVADDAEEGDVVADGAGVPATSARIAMDASALRSSLGVRASGAPAMGPPNFRTFPTGDDASRYRSGLAALYELREDALIADVHLTTGTAPEVYAARAFWDPNAAHYLKGSVAQAAITSELTSHKDREALVREARTRFHDGPDAPASFLGKSPTPDNLFGFVKAMLRHYNDQGPAAHLWVRKQELPESWLCYLRRSEGILLGNDTVSLRVFSKGALFEVDMSTRTFGQEHLRGFLAVRQMIVIARFMAEPMAIKGIAEDLCRLYMHVFARGAGDRLALPIESAMAIDSPAFKKLEAALGEYELRARAPVLVIKVLTNDAHDYGVLGYKMLAITSEAIEAGLEDGTIRADEGHFGSVLRSLEAVRDTVVHDYASKLGAAPHRSAADYSVFDGGARGPWGTFKVAAESQYKDHVKFMAGKRLHGAISETPSAPAAAERDAKIKRGAELAVYKRLGLCMLCGQTYSKDHKCASAASSGGGSGRDGSGGGAPPSPSPTPFRPGPPSSAPFSPSGANGWPVGAGGGGRSVGVRGAHGGAGHVSGHLSGRGGGGGGGHQGYKFKQAATAAAAAAAAAAGRGASAAVCWKCGKAGHKQVACNA